MIQPNRSLLVLSLVLTAISVGLWRASLHDEVDSKIDASDHINGPSGNTANRTKRLVLFSAGHGTTATRSYFDAVCRVGIPAVHWEAHCSTRMPTMPRHHVAVVATFKRIQECCESPIDDCTLDNLRNWINHMKSNTTALLESQVVDALLDSPYTLVSQHILRSIRGDSQWFPFVLLTERDPPEWARSRIAHHNPLICRLLLGQATYGALDLDACLDAVDEQDPPPKTIGEVFTTAQVLLRGSDVNATIREQTEHYFALALDQHQLAMQEPHPNYVVNLWKTEMNNTAIVEDLEVQIIKAVGDSPVSPAFPRARIPARYEGKDWWNRTRT